MGAVFLDIGIALFKPTPLCQRQPTAMLRVLSHQALEAVPRPGLCLTASRYAHNMQAPYTGPPSHQTIARRLTSSEIDLQPYFIRKHQQDAKGRGEFVDILEGGINLAHYDVLITDISHETLETTIAEQLVIPYLSQAAESATNEVVERGGGIGDTVKPIVPFVVSRGDELDGSFHRGLMFSIDIPFHSGECCSYHSHMRVAPTERK